jgi:glycosyltransferase involved in cell wall biosynthesis
MSNKIKVFVDASQFSKEFQGTRTYIKELYISLAKSSPDFEINLAIIPNEKLEKEFSAISNIGFIYLKKVDWFKRMNFEIPRLIKQGNYTHAHFQYTIPFNRSKSCKYIVTIHDILFNDFPSLFPIIYRISRNILFSYAARNADYLLTVSSYSKKRIASQYKISDNEIIITPNGVNTEYFNTYDKKKVQDEILNEYGIASYFLYVSRVEPRKNQLQLLEVFLKLDTTSKQLVFIGKRSIKFDAFEEAIANLDTKDKKRVHFMEQLEQDELLKFYQAAYAFVYPTKAEGFGIPPLEAGAVGIPVICSQSTAMEDFTFFDPYRYNPENEDDLEQIMKTLIRDYSEYDVVSIAHKIKQKYSWDQTALKMKKSVFNIG